MAISLARAGSRVVVTSRGEQDLDNAIVQLRPWQRMAKRVVADVDDPDAGQAPLHGGAAFQRRHRPEPTLDEECWDEGSFPRAAFLAVQIFKLDGGETL